MADVKHLKDRGLPLKIDGSTKFVRGTTKYTTCNDVIKMVLKKLGISKEYRHMFAIYEITQTGEQALSGKARVLKIAKEWQSDRNKFALRKISSTDDLSIDTAMKKEPRKAKTSKKQEQKFLTKITNALRPKSASTKDNRSEAKQTMKDEENIHDNTTDSETSLEEFLSGINPSKMVEFIQFYNAMKNIEEKNLRQKSSKKCATVSNNVARDEELRRGARLKSCKKLARSRSKRRGHARRRPLNDVHPSKIHSVQKLDYGFLDGEKDDEEEVTTNSITDVSMKSSFNISRKTVNDRLSTDSETTFQKQKFSFKRYFSHSHAQSYDMRTFEPDQDIKYLHETEVNNLLARSFTTTGLDQNKANSKCHEIWNEDFRREIDSAHDSASSDDSLDNSLRFAKSMSSFSAADQIEANLRINKLVDYSITDDELSDMDTEDECFDGSCNGLDIGYCTAESSSVDNNSSGQHNTTFSSLSEYCYHVNKGFSSDSDSDIDMFDIATSSSFMKTGQSANTSEFIRDLFAKQNDQNEDDEMDSFMKSKVHDESLGDGLSWLQSDDELIC